MSKYVIEFEDVRNENTGVQTIGMIAQVVEGDPDDSLAVEYGASFAAMIHATLESFASCVSPLGDEDSYRSTVAAGVKVGEGYVEKGLVH